MRDVAGTPLSITPPDDVAPLGLAVAAGLLGGSLLALWSPWLLPAWVAAGLGLWGAVLWSGCWQEGLSRALARVRQARDWPIPITAPGHVLRKARRVAGSVLLGVALATAHAAWSLSVQLPAAMEQGEVELRGRIVDLPAHEPRRTRFHFRVDADATPELRGRLLRLAWYEDGAIEGTPRRHALRAGEHWSIRARLRAPRGLRNPGGVDSERYALAGRLSATGYVRAPQLARRLQPPGGLAAWREGMSDRITQGVPQPASRFIRALALGDTRGLDESDWQVLRADGLTHLIAISGFHVGLVAGFAALLARAVWWLFPALARRCPAPVAAAVAAVAGATLYAAAAGFALPTLRTALMIAVVAGARTARRALRAQGALALALIALLLVDPLAILGAGFWLSFLGVAWLLWCLPNGGRSPVRDFLSAQGVATVGLLPLGVALFGQASLAGPFANLVAVPWWSLVVVPLSLAGLLMECLHAGAGVGLWQWAAACFEATWPLFQWLGRSDLALWWLPEARWFALPLALAGAFWLLMPRGVPGKSLAVLLWLPLLWPDRVLPRHGEAELVVLDVGQGLSVLVRTARHSLLYDMGPAVQDGFDAGERAVVPALHALGVRRIDRAVVSHADNDHAGGYEAVVREFAVASTWAPEDSPLPPGSRRCRAGQPWVWDGVRLEFLHPPPHFPYLANESSCVLRIETAHGAALLTGDIGEVVERRLVDAHGSRLRSSIVVIAHHGSSGSSDPGFVHATGARFALASTGHGNRFGHPRPEIVGRWQQAGAQTADTAASGALRVGLRAHDVRLETRRGAQLRLWDASRRP